MAFRHWGDHDTFRIVPPPPSDIQPSVKGWVAHIRPKKIYVCFRFRDRLTIYPIGDHIENKWSKSDHFERSYEVLKTKFSKISANITVAQTRHFIKHLLHDFTKHLLHDFTISSTILQFTPRYYNFLHDFTISSTILQFPPRFYNLLHDFTKHLLHDFTKHLLHDFTISSTILQFSPRFYNFLHDFTIFSTILQFSPRYYKIVEQIIKSWRKL